MWCTAGLLSWTLIVTSLDRQNRHSQGNPTIGREKLLSSVITCHGVSNASAGVILVRRSCANLLRMLAFAGSVVGVCNVSKKASFPDCCVSLCVARSVSQSRMLPAGLQEKARRFRHRVNLQTLLSHWLSRSRPLASVTPKTSLLLIPLQASSD